MACCFWATASWRRNVTSNISTFHDACATYTNATHMLQIEASKEAGYVGQREEGVKEAEEGLERGS